MTFPVIYPYASIGVGGMRRGNEEPAIISAVGCSAFVLST